MVSQRPSLLIDTNVWLDYFLPDRAGGKEAIDLIVFAFEYEFPLLYPAAIVKDVFYVAVSTFKRIARAEKGSLTQSGKGNRNRVGMREQHAKTGHRRGRGRIGPLDGVQPP